VRWDPARRDLARAAELLRVVPPGLASDVGLEMVRAEWVYQARGGERWGLACASDSTTLTTLTTGHNSLPRARAPTPPVIFTHTPFPFTVSSSTSVRPLQHLVSIIPGAMGSGSGHSSAAGDRRPKHKSRAPRMQVPPLTKEELAARIAQQAAWEREVQARIAQRAAEEQAEASAAAAAAAASAVMPPSIGSADDVPVSRGGAEKNHDVLSAGTGELWAASPFAAAPAGGASALRPGSLPVVSWQGYGGSGPASAPEQQWGPPLMGLPQASLPFSAPSTWGVHQLAPSDTGAVAAGPPPAPEARQAAASLPGPAVVDTRAQGASGEALPTQQVHASFLDMAAGARADTAPLPLSRSAAGRDASWQSLDGEARDEHVRPSLGSMPETASLLAGSRAHAKRSLKPAKDRSNPSSKKPKKALTFKAASKVVETAAMLAARATPPMTSGDADAADSSTNKTTGKKNAPSLSKSDAAVAKAVIDGMRPLCVEVADASKELQRLREDLSRLAAKVDNQGVGQEHAARAIVEIRDGKTSAKIKDEHAANVKTEVPFMEKPAAEKLAIAARNNAEMSAIRDEVRATHVDRAANTSKSDLVLANADAALDLLYEVTARVRGVDSKAAEVYVHSSRMLPTTTVDKKTGVKAKPKKMTEPLNQVVPHLIDKFKLASLPAYWEVLGLAVPVDEQDARVWLLKDEFLTSEKGQRGIVAMAKAFFLSVGAGHRIVKKTGPGGGEYVQMTVGHYMLFGSFVRHELMVWAGWRRRKHPGGAGTVRRWVSEAAALKEWLPTNDRIFNGMRLVDGAASRAYFYELAAKLPARDPADINDSNGDNEANTAGSGTGSDGAASVAAGIVDDDAKTVGVPGGTSAAATLTGGDRGDGSVAGGGDALDDYADADLLAAVPHGRASHSDGNHGEHDEGSAARRVWYQTPRGHLDGDGAEEQEEGFEGSGDEEARDAGGRDTRGGGSDLEYESLLEEDE